MVIKPSFPLLATISITSASSLAYEVLLMRLFSIIQWHHFAYMIISLALLGYGISGTFLAIFRDRLKQKFPSALIANTALFSVAMPICFLLAQQIPFNPAEILWTPVQLAYLLFIYLILAIPFFFAANVIGLSYSKYKESAASIYTADLLGAGIGSAGIILLLFILFPQKILIVLAVLGVVATLIVSNVVFRDPAVETKLDTGVFLIVLAFVAVITSLTALNISPYKSLSQLLQIPDATVVDRYSSPLGLIDIVRSPITPLRHAPGLSLNATSEPPEQLALFTDADNMAAITRNTGKPEALQYLDQTTSALPYHLKQLDDILILGAGTGSDIRQAKNHNPKHIDAVELNPQIINLIKGKYADFTGHIYSGNSVNVTVGDIRGNVATTDKAYDLINLSLLDAFGAPSGLYSMAENYLYTEEAVATYLRHVKPDGYLSVTRWVKIPPRDEPKLLATVINALKPNPLAHPERQLLMIRSWQTSTLIVKNGVVTKEETDRLKYFCNSQSFDLVYYPGISESETNQFNIQLQPYLHQAAVALLSADNPSFIEDYKFNIEPATDDKPYFFHFFKWETLSEILPLLDSGGIFLLESGYLLLIAALLQAILASLLLIALPLWLTKNKLGFKPAAKNYLPVLSYFFCLGLAFLFIEIAFMQKFILILHHPIYAITTVLSTFLLAAGAGGKFSSRLSGSIGIPSILLPTAAIAMLSVAYILGLGPVTGFLLKTGDLSRYLFAVLLIVPLGFFMGMPFPMGLNKLSQTIPALIPWAWGINGCASVISTILATLIAMQFGFNVLIIMAILCYGAAALSFQTLSL